MMMKKSFLPLIVCLAAVLLILPAGCSKKKPAPEKEKSAAKAGTAHAALETRFSEQYEPLRAALKQQGLNPGLLMEFDGNLYYTYEISRADEYDDQALVVLGKALGLMGGYTRDTATMIFTAGGEPLMRFTAKKADLLALAAGEINGQELFLRLDSEVVSKP